MLRLGARPVAQIRSKLTSAAEILGIRPTATLKGKVRLYNLYLVLYINLLLFKKNNEFLYMNQILFT